MGKAVDAEVIGRIDSGALEIEQYCRYVEVSLFK